MLREWSAPRPWLRIRGHPFSANQQESIGREIEALHDLCVHGFQPILFLRWSEKSWAGGIRSGGGRRLPLDLREVYQRGFDYGRTYGASGAAFEIENEPDISFVQENPETYVAFLKAAYLGIKRGALNSEVVSGKRGALNTPEVELSANRIGLKAAVVSLVYRRHLSRRGGTWEPLNRRELAAYSLSLAVPRSTQSPLVVMAPLALPPGPYFEQLVANGLFSYTDAFNYHYYGYADDFSGVYRQFESAVKELGSKPKAVGRKLNRLGSGDGRQQTSIWPLPFYSSFKKTLPILLTEYGYGSLSGEDRDTIEGRVRQWRWFKSVGGQIHKLRIAGPMAFYLPPYLEGGALEFGLTTPTQRAAESNDVGRGFRTPPNDSEKAKSGDSVLQFTAGPLKFSPQDFGLTRSTPWMGRIGQRFGDNEATPAWAWLLEEGSRKPYRPKDWGVCAPAPFPVVIDFISGDGLVQQKRYGGYVAVLALGDPALHTKSGSGQLVLYNFSDSPVQGWLKIIRGRELLADAATVEREWTLEPMARVVVPVTFAVPAQEFARREFALRFASATTSESPAFPALGKQPSTLSSQFRALTSVFSTFFYPEASAMQETLLHDFSRAISDQESETSGERHSSPTAVGGQGRVLKNIKLLARRPLAVEEPRLEATGRWNVTRGVRVEELANRIWRFHITAFPTEPNKPAMAELVLPDGFTFPDEGMMRFNYRLVQPAGSTLANGKYMDAYFRTANGNLYQVWPRQYAMAAWSDYTEVKENYTMAFYGRANLPWRFRDNRPVALVFFFRPGRGALPAIYEVKDARIVKLAAGD